MSCSRVRSNRTVCGVADVTQQHTCQVTERSARLECGWLALTYLSHCRSSVDRANITLIKKEGEGDGRST
jgi:hypothetical protein